MRPPRLFPAFLLLALLVTGCASSRTGVPASAPTPGAAGEGDVLLDGVSLVGRWNAIGALDEPDVDSDLRSGMLTETLVIRRGGGATLTGVDERAATGQVRLEGRIAGDRLTFADLPGEATLTVRGDGRIVVTDPRGYRTVYERE